MAVLEYLLSWELDTNLPIASQSWLLLVSLTPGLTGPDSKILSKLNFPRKSSVYCIWSQDSQSNNLLTFRLLSFEIASLSKTPRLLHLLRCLPLKLSRIRRLRLQIAKWFQTVQSCSSTVLGMNFCTKRIVCTIIFLRSNQVVHFESD